MGHFIFKFLKELNSATSSKMMVLAVVLGFMAGFLPFVNFFTVLIFIIVLVFRIPIGLFLASFSFFEFIGYFLDPVFNKTGLFLLNLSFLKPIWTFFYNLPFVRWSGFNNTIVMGSLVFGIVFGIILYFILDKAVKLYRSKVFEKLKTKKYLSWLVPNEKKGIIRIAGVGFIAVVTAGVILFFVFLLDPIVKYSLEFSLSHLLHKKVAIEKVDTSVKNLSVNIQNMQIGDVLFKKVYTKLAWDKIVWRKYKIDDLTFIAKTDKNIFNLIKNTSSNSNKTKSKSGFNLNIKLPSPNEFLAKQQLKSLQAIKKLKADYKKVYKDLKKVDTKKYKAEFDNLKSKINSLKSVKISSPEDFQKLTANIDSVKKEANNLLKKIKQDKNLLSNDKKLIEKDLNNLKIALKEDKNNIKSKYEMIKNKEYLNFAETMLKPQISKYLKTASSIYEKVKPYIHSSNKKENEYIRAKGIYVKFKDKTNYPDFVLVKSLGEVETSIAKWNVKAGNISDNQQLLNKRAFVKIRGKSKFFDVGADVNYLKDIKFSGYGNKIDIKKLDLNLVSLKALANMKINGVIANDDINSKIFVYFYKPRFIPNKNMKILNELNSIKHFKVLISLKGKMDSPKIKINSDLDKYFSKIIKNRVNSLINKNTKKAQKLLNAKINDSLKGMKLNDVNMKLKDLNSLEGIKQLINKELKDIIKSKQKSILKNKIKKFLPF